MKTNGHVWYGYDDGDHVPTLPLVMERREFNLNNPYTVEDAEGCVIAAFRNRADLERFMTETKKRYELGDRKRSQS
ncbi:hypothetical protein [Paraburkholderia sp. RL18-085-BIA-A]|uniref:hypothetical protein n=1 Tax=Paraburkholderia sp. RL18-085-BIA-A TaxID=3031633 RepID=UPI0038BAE9FD